MYTYFELISEEQIENLLKTMHYSDLEYNGHYEQETDGTKWINYIGYIDTLYEMQIQVVSSEHVKVYDRMLDEKHYVFQGEWILVNEKWERRTPL